ncbi:MAG TPA: ribonuclease T [Cyanothece sp. UBA12306]|nr:ribonuclease T [Cyanothece sp. UBA12306]
MLRWKKGLLVAIVLAIALFCLPMLPAQAFVPVDGTFIANDSCEALQSIRKGTNPGNVTLTPDVAYEVVGQNKPEPSHYQIKIKGVQPARWVSVGCGRLLTNCSQSVIGSGTEPEKPTTSNKCPSKVSTDNLLAISWQPSFCETHQSKTECQSQDASDFDAKHFTLHGLWPQPRGKEYCCLPSNFTKKPWSAQPTFDDELEDETLALLKDERRMPGVQSFLHRHEWYKHGTCYNPTSSEPEQEYFEESLALLNQINKSSVQSLFASRIGQRVTLDEVQAAFEQDFGPGAGSKVKLKCSDGLISELWINLTGDIESDTPLTTLLANAKDARSKCQGGKIDAVGFNN